MTNMCKEDVLVREDCPDALREKERTGSRNAALHLCPHAMWVQAQVWRTNMGWHLVRLAQRG
jgi:hypothetical protein